MGVSSDIEDGLGKTGRLLTRSGVAPADYTGRWDVGYYRIGVELVSRQHKLRSALQTSALDSSSNPLRITVSSETLQIQLNQIAMQIKVIGGSRYFDGQAIPVGGGGSATGEVEAGWGIQHWDQRNIYRTVRTDGAAIPTYALVFLGALHLETFLKPSNFPSVVTTAFEKITYNLTGYSISLKDFWWRMLEPLRDLALSQVVTTYDPFIDAVGALPTPTSRVGVADGWVLLGSKSLGKNVLRYSTLTRDEPENFPAANQYDPEDGADDIKVIERAGDVLVAIASGAIYRAVRSGTAMAIGTLVPNVGGVGRWGSTTVGSTLYLVTQSGLKAVDVNTGGVTPLAAVDRMMLDERKWQDSLANVHVEYDAFAGCLILLNTTRKEAILFWESTGTVTTLENCPWRFLTAGPDVTTGGPRRVFWVMDDGRVHCIDAGWDMTHRLMCSPTFPNGTAALTLTTISGSTTTTLNFNPIIVPGGLPPDCKGFYLHFTSGNLAGTSTVVSAVTGGYQVTVPALSSVPDVGSQVSVAPIVFRVVLPQVPGSNDEFDPFERKRVKTIMPSIVSVPGFGSTVTLGCYRRSTKLAGKTSAGGDVPDQGAVYVGDTGAHGVEVYPYVESLIPNQDFELKALRVLGEVTGSTTETRQV